MSQPSDPRPSPPAPAGTLLQTEQQETVLLSELPEVLSSAAEPSRVSQDAAPHLGTTALAALSQRYDILGEAGHGSMGNVYKARDQETGEVVALKLLKPEIASDQAMMERFKNELLFARKITHKNVCRVYEFNRIGGVAYTSMEFVEGESLRSVLNRFGGLPTRKATDLMLQICSGLKEAHAQGIVHRDLKPENVMIDPDGNVKIMDFGVARSMEAMTRTTGSMVGTPAYMAPEQVAGKPVDYRTDIYALGLMLYEVCTGSQAFRADNAVAVALKQMREAPTPPHEVDPTIPVPIERAILKCLEKDPTKRFPSIADLEKALRGTEGASSSPAAAPNAVIAAAPSIHAPLPLASLPSRMPPASRKRSSPVVWLLFAGVALAGWAGWRSFQINQAAQRISPPPAFELPAPEPPDFALDATAPSSVVQQTTPEPEKAAPSKPTPAKVNPPANAAAPSNSPAGSSSNAASEFTNGGNLPQALVQNMAPQAVQQRAAKAFGEAGPSPTAAGSPDDGNGGYIWVGRYQREDRAQDASKRIADLGLPAVVLPRHNITGEFFVVISGPFGSKRLPSVLKWLQTQGFPGAHMVKPPQGSAPGLNQSPKFGADGKPNS